MGKGIYIVYKVFGLGVVMKDYKIKIENVVASTQIGENIDLNKIAREVKDAEYKPKQFPGLVLRTKEPKAAALVFRSGKVVCTGSKSVEDARRAVKQVVKIIGALGIPVIDEPDVRVQNIVASADLGVDLNLNAIAIGLGLENIEYEPEQFPGLVYRLDNPRVVVLIFGSGKMVVTGGKNPEDARRAVERIAEELSTLGLM
jgi:transcription initiation factor TFIID TATA-box-binding protein